MSDVDKLNLNQKAVPFFARYLEGQINFLEEISDEEAATVGGGLQAMTKKFPSDQEDSSAGGGAVTLKFPSDQEDSSGGGAVTLKFPSDQEDSSGGNPCRP